jgi:hypothetical protein
VLAIPTSTPDLFLPHSAYGREIDSQYTKYQGFSERSDIHIITILGKAVDFRKRTTARGAETFLVVIYISLGDYITVLRILHRYLI